jgi:hypothetical protein
MGPVAEPTEAMSHSLTLNPQMEFSVLNPNGPFVLLNPSPKLRSGETYNLVLSFSPQESILVSTRPGGGCSPGPHTLQEHIVAADKHRPRTDQARVCKWLAVLAMLWLASQRRRRAVGTPGCLTSMCPSQTLRNRVPHVPDGRLILAKRHGLLRLKKHWTSSPREAPSPSPSWELVWHP